MNENTDNKITKCRICLDNKPNQLEICKTITIEEEDVSILNVLFHTTNLHIYEGDKKPWTICLACSNDAKHAYNFKLRCERADAILNKDLEDNLMEQDPLKIKEEEVDEKLSSKDDSDVSLQEEIDLKIQCNKNDNAVDNNKISLKQNSKTKKTIFLCQICGVKRNSKKEMYLHLMTIHKRLKKTKAKSSIPCCGKLFGSLSALNDHMNTHTEVDTMSCTVCDKKFSNKYNLQNHKLIHSEEKPYKCTECDKSFIYSLSFKNHMANHLNERSHECGICGKRYNTVQQLQQHRTRHKKYQCDKCGKEFSPYHCFQQHMRDHNKKQIICDVCGKGFTRVHYLKIHKMIHTGEKRYHCEICKKGFIYAYCLRTHVKTHEAEGDKPKMKKNKK